MLMANPNLLSDNTSQIVSVSYNNKTNYPLASFISLLSFISFIYKQKNISLIYKDMYM